MGENRGWTVWRGKYLIRARIWSEFDRIGDAHRDRFPELAETGDETDVLIGLLAVLAEDLAEEGPTTGELGFLMERALGRDAAPERIETALAAAGAQVWRMEMGREAYYVLEPAGRDRAAALARPKEAAQPVWRPAPHLRVRLAG